MPQAVTDVWNQLLVFHLEEALLWLTALTGSAGIAIIAFTAIVRTAMLPLSLQQIKSQRAMAALQPKLKELQERYKGDRGRMGQEQIKLYKEAGVNPAAGCLPLLIQMPIWFALYSSLYTLSHASQLCASEATAASSPVPCSDAVVQFSHGFLWIQNMAEASMPHPDNPATWALVIFPVLTALTQWIVQKMSTMPTADPQTQQMNRMMEFMPFMFLMFSFQVPAGLTLYWVTSNVYSIAQQRALVGWGSLPFLGGKSPPAAPTSRASEPARPPERQPGSPPARRRGPTNSSGRKRKGK